MTMWTTNLVVFCYVLASIVLEPNGSASLYNGCGGNIEVSGVTNICSPNFPHAYTRGAYCDWHVRSLSKFYITLIIYKLEDNYDILRLWDNGHLISTPRKVNSTRFSYVSIRQVPVDYLRINFVSDPRSKEYGGFCVVAETLGTLSNLIAKNENGTSSSCGGNLSITGPATIHSPNYPSNYGRYVDCTWYLYAKGGQSLRINVTDVNIEYSQTCNHDVLRLWATKNRTGVAPYQQFCGNLTLISTLRTQHLWINFQSDGQVQSKGFRIVVDIDKSRNCDGVRDFHQATSRGDIRLMQDALDRGFDINCKYNSQSSLHVAVSKRAKAIIKFLLNKGADVNITDAKGRSPLFNAVTMNSLPLTSLLLQRGADINNTDSNGETIFHVIARKGFLRLIQFALVNGADDQIQNKEGFTATHIAAENGHVEACDMLINSTNMLSTRTILGMTPLHIAARKGNVEMARLLVDRGARINAADRNLATPLHYAVNANSFEVTQYLVLRGAHVDARNRQKATALFASAVMGNTDIAEFLVNHGANISARMVSGETPLHVAVKSKSTAVMAFLIIAGADIAATDKKKNTVFNMCAISSECHKIMMESVLLRVQQKQTRKQQRTNR